MEYKQRSHEWKMQLDLFNEIWTFRVCLFLRYDLFSHIIGS